MKLQRHDARADYGGGTYPVEDDGGEYYLAADVDDLLSSIRAAVGAERRATVDACSVSPPDGYEDRFYDARAALDALLSGAEVDR